MKNCDESNHPARGEQPGERFGTQPGQSGDHGAQSGEDSGKQPGAQDAWGRLRRFLAHAFSVAPEGGLTEKDYALLDAIAGKVVQRGLASPVLLALHSAAPLGFIGSQAMIALQPFADWIVPAGQYERFARILERREGIEILMRRIEKAEADVMAPPPKGKI